ncbi:MAG: beta-ketoacyl synthase N-terminal-like domain-containing protein [Candidatus Methylumidiphilus sp.]
MSHESQDESPKGIAIIGMAARMPGAANLDAFWANLRDGVESIARFTEEELLESGLVDLETIRHPLFVPTKGILDDVDLFDAAFFGISPREAELMDPQHRLLMECAVEVLEHAGYDAETYPGRIAVFTSVGMNTYLPFNILSNPGLAEEVGGFQLSIYNDKDFVPTRIAYAMNLKGPGVDIGTACSSSLVSTHFACQHLLTYQSDMVLVGGISVHLPQKTGHVHEAGTAYSPDGHCRPFDATPSGLVDGNGMAAIVLKRLEDALEDGDHIYAVIKGSAINNDGAAKVGYAAPSVAGQAEVIVEAQAIAGVHPDSISYVEAHGTATPLGDPIEVAALTEAFRVGTERKGYCGLGSAKSNIGHVDKAAGLAGLIKTVLAMRHGQLPPSLHYQAPNPRLNLPETPFYVVGSLRDWPRDGQTPRRAGISSFGVGGTNAHAIIEEAPAVPPGSPALPSQIVTVSAKTEAALAEAAANLAAYLEQNPGQDFADVCHTLHRGRRPYAHRLAFACGSAAEAVAALRGGRRGQGAQHNGVVFMFPGQGSQYLGMAAALHRHEPVFREHLDRCADLLRADLGLDLRSLLFPEADAAAAAAERLEQTALAQPALFAVEYALAQLWMSWGVEPQAMIGHSIGEYVAACLAGVFSLQDALALVAARGRLMQAQLTGAMLAVPLAEAALPPLPDAGLDLAAVNAPALCVVSGPVAAVEAFAQKLAAQGLDCRRLHTSHAFHSAMMAPMLDEFTALLRRVDLQPPRLPYLSNVTGDWISAEDATQPDYWTRHLRQTVRFAAGLAKLSDGALLLEVGPGRTSGGLAAQSLPAPQCLYSLPHAKEPRDALAFAHQSLAEFWAAGGAVDWAGFHRHERRLRLALPTYPFQRRRYWIEPGQRYALGAPAVGKTDPADWFHLPSWKTSLTPPAPATSEDAALLLFADGSGLAPALAEAWPGAVFLAEAAPAFARRDGQRYGLNPKQPADIDALLDDIAAQGVTLGRVVSVGGKAAHLLPLLQALLRRVDAGALELTVVASGLCDIAGETATNPDQAALLGLLRALPWEAPRLACRAIDIPAAGPALADRLVRELAAPPTEPLVALPPGQRWTPDLQTVRLDAATSTGLLREAGVYVLSAGLTPAGRLFARQLASTVQAKLVLLSLAPACELAEQALAELQALGAETLALTLDGFDAAALENALAEAERRFGRIDGFIHAADMGGARPFAPLADLPAEELAQHLDAQAATLDALEQCLVRRDLDFCALMSSLAAETGGLGQAAHSAAALYLHARAQGHNRAGGTAWIVVDWDLWKDAADDANLPAALAELAFSPAEVAEAFGRIFAHGGPGRLLVSKSDPRSRRDALRLSADAAPAAADSAGRHSRPDLPNAYEAPRNPDEAAMAALWQEFLRLEQIGIHDNFFDLGGHSLLATQLASRLRQTFGVPVELALFFTAPTVAELTEALNDKRQQQTGEAQLAEWLHKLEGMADDEVQALLDSGALPADWLGESQA